MCWVRMEAAESSGKLVSYCITTWCQNTEDRDIDWYQIKKMETQREVP